MKVLMLTPYLRYPDSSGGQIRTLNLLKHLCKDNEITLFSLIKDKKENENIKHLLKYCKKVRTFQRSKTPWTLKNILRTGFSWHPFLVIRNWASGEKAAIKQKISGTLSKAVKQKKLKTLKLEKSNAIQSELARRRVLKAVIWPVFVVHGLLKFLGL